MLALSGPAPTGPCLSSAEVPELDTVLQVGSHQSGAEWQNHLPRHVRKTSCYAAQNTVGFLACKCTLLAHVQLFIHQYPQVGRTVLHPFFFCIYKEVCSNPGAGLWAHSCEGLLRSLWMTCLPPSKSTAPLSLGLSANLLRVHKFPLRHR